MTIRYITSYKGGAGKSHIAVLMGHLLPDPVVIEHATAQDAAGAFPQAVSIRFTGDADCDLLTLESVLGDLSDHQNIVVNTPPSFGFTMIRAHADLLAPLAAQFGHDSEMYLVVDDAPVLTDVQTLIETLQPAPHIVFNKAGPQTRIETWPFTKALGAVIEATGAQTHRIPRLPHPEVGAFLRDRKPRSLLTRTLAKRYLATCGDLANSHSINRVKEVTYE
jgi:hypothetical protein